MKSEIDGNVCAGGDKTDARDEKEDHHNRMHSILPYLSSEINADEYNMMHPKRGRLLVFNHKTFDDKLDMRCRQGTDADRDHLVTVFRHLGFEVDVHNNLSYKSLKDKLDKASRCDYGDSDCFACVVLTHGEDGRLFARDSMYRCEELWTPFLGNECPTLAGKPKLFFIQACRGKEVDDGLLVQGRLGLSYDSSQVLKIPAHADFLIAYSTVAGYYSWRNTVDGSWFIQGLCEVLSKFCDTTDVLSMMTIVNRYVAYNFVSNTPTDFEMHQKKQIPCISSMLTRKLFFRQK